jgi:hypothetical protein
VTVKLKGQWKKDSREYNGLDDEANRKSIIGEPLKRFVVVGLVECSKVEELVQDGGTKVPTMNFVQVEVTTGDDAVVVQEIMDKVFRERTGRGSQRSLFDQDDPSAVADAGRVLAGDVGQKIQTSCGALEQHDPHEGDGWACDGAGTNGSTVAEAGAADSGRREIPAAPEFSDQTPDDDEGPRRGGRRR